MNDARIDISTNTNPAIDSLVTSDKVLDISSVTDQIFDADFAASNGLGVSLNPKHYVDVTFGAGYSMSDCKVLYATTARWNSDPTRIAKRGYVYIYSDWKTDTDGQYLAGIKIGDGSAYLIDLPFLDEIYYKHLEDRIVHITQQEREFWNDKVRCYIDPINPENLIFTTQ